MPVGVEKRLAVLVLALAGRISAQETGREPAQLALLVGCSEYPALREALGERYERELALRGPENDVELVRATLERVLGLARERTTVLAGWKEDVRSRPTRANVLAALERLAREARAGDEVILYLAGHGSQQRVQRIKPEEEPDGLEEVFLCADARAAEKDQGHIPNSIRDDELGDAVRRIRDAGASVWLIVDACHSGTLLRGGPDPGADVRLRGIAPVLLGVTTGLRGGRAGTPRADERWIDGADTARIAALYGATSYGRAPEMALPRGASDARSRGLFTFLLCQELERTGARASYRELAERVVAAYQAFPCALTVPTAEGDLERAIAGGAALEAPLLCTLRGDTAYLNQGRLSGIEPGVEAELFQLAEGAERAVGRVKVVAADLFEARAGLVAGELSRDAGPWRARTDARPLGDYRLGVALVRPDGSSAPREDLPAALSQALAAEAQRFPFVAAAEADWWIVARGSERLWLRPGPCEGGCDLFGVDAARCPAVLRDIQAARNLRRFAGGEFTARWTGELDVWVERSAGGRWQRLHPEAAGEAVLHPGEEIRVWLQKTSEAIYDVHVFYLDANFGVKLLFPRSGTEARLAATARAAQDLTGPMTVTDDALGLEHVLVFATPRAESSPILDLSVITWRGQMRGADGSRPDAFAELLRSVVDGSAQRGEPLSVAETRGTQAKLLTLRTGWGELAPPPWPSEVARGERVRAPPGPDGPRERFLDPWTVGPRAAVVKSRRELGRPDLLLLGNEEVEAVLVDLDGDSPSGYDAARLVQERRFEAEAAFLFGSPRAAHYDRTGDGAFDLVLIDAEGDGLAEERWAREGERWLHDENVALPWLSQGYVRLDPGARAEAARRLAVLQGPR